jgi:hypothetical protein
MKKYRFLLMIVALVFASLACQAVTGKKSDGGQSLPPVKSDDGGTAIAPSDSSPSTAGGGSGSSDSQFPMTKDAYNITDIGDGSLLYYSKMPTEDVMKFYRDDYTAKGYKERELLTVVSGNVFSMVFDGDPSGKAIVIQSVDMGDGSRTVAIRLEDV